MKSFTKLFALVAAFCFSLTCSMAECPLTCQQATPATCPCEQQAEVYAHPSMFGSDAQQVATAKSTYVVGGKICKAKNRLGVKNKKRVVVSSWANDVLNIIKTSSDVTAFNPKMPILRSEFAVVLSEGFNMTDGSIKKSYSDISSNYWAKNWIYRALNGGVMIGYPEGVFKPDQPITKAEVFATIATMINVPTDGTNNVPQFKGKDIAYIPAWAAVATQEVVNSKLLEEVPNSSKINTEEYLSTEQVAYLVSAIRASFLAKTLDKDVNAPCGIKSYEPVAINVKLTERISARHSNVGDRFNAKTTNAVTVLGKDFPVGSIVTGKVVEVVRPGINNKNQGYIKVKFLTLKNKDVKVDFPASLSEAQANTLKNPNIIARLVGAPLTGAARVVGVVGRTGAAGVEVCANGLEQYGDQLSNTLVNTCTLHPGSGLKSFGNSFVTVGKGVFRLCELAVSGTFGVIYEVGDELLYVILPSFSNASSLNPNEELTILF